MDRLMLAQGHALVRVVLALCLALFASISSADDQEKDYNRPVIIRMEGVITPLTQQFIERRLEQARSMGADLVIIEIESPGGMVEPSFAIAEMLRDLSWAPTVAYIPREALSGAAFVALGCKKILIEPDARLGDAGPIVAGEDGMFRHAPEKIVSDLAVRVRQLAEAAGRPPGLAEAMVKRDLEVFEVTNTQTGEKTFMTDAEIADTADPQQWNKGKLVFESRMDHFLEVTGKRAVELGLADANVDSFEDLQQQLKLQRAPIRLKATTVDTIVFVLNHPISTVLLLLTGMVLLYVELSAPGIGIAGVGSALCFTLFFWSRFLGGTSGWLEILLFILGVACLAMELFVLPGFGIMGISGILLIVTSFVLASQTFVIPHTTADYLAFGKSLRDIFIVVGLFIGAAALITRYFEHLPIFGSMVLLPVADDEKVDPVIGSTEPEQPDPLSALVGKTGVARTPLRPAGKVRLDDKQVIDVVAEGEFVDAGRPVRVVFVQGNRIVVREVDAT